MGFICEGQWRAAGRINKEVSWVHPHLSARGAVLRCSLSGGLRLFLYQIQGPIRDNCGIYIYKLEYCKEIYRNHCWVTGIKLFGHTIVIKNVHTVILGKMDCF